MEVNISRCSRGCFILFLWPGSICSLTGVTIIMSMKLGNTFGNCAIWQAARKQIKIRSMIFGSLSNNSLFASTRAIFMWSVLFDNFYFLALAPSTRAVINMWQVLFICHVLATRSVFIWKQKIRDLDLWMKLKNCQCYVLSRLHGQFSVYVTIFICHIKTNTPVFQ